MPLKIGAYIRVSTEEQANIVEGSLDSQQHRIKAYIDIKNHQEKDWGKLVEIYIDDGYSAGSTKRPAYQKLLRDLRNGKINLILVTDLSRLSRNISDFCGLQDQLKEYKAKFLSIKEQFDTSTPAGEMMLFNMINLAQFERKQTSERVSVNFHTRATKGLANGGSKVLGYETDPQHSGKLIVIKEEAATVRRVFELYQESKSLRETARKLTEEQKKPKVHSEKRATLAREGIWTHYSVRTVLKNMAYIGLREINRKYKDEDQSQLKSWQRYQIVKAAWSTIVEESVFSDVQKSIDEGYRLERQRLETSKERVFLLSGIFRCGECGKALVGQAAHGRTNVHLYYGHSKLDEKNIKCSIKRFNAKKIEKAVLNHLDEMLRRSGHLDSIEDNIKSYLSSNSSDLLTEKKAKESELHTLDVEIDNIFKVHFSMDKGSQGYQLISERLETLAQRKKSLKTYLATLNDRLATIYDAKEARLNLEDKIKTFHRGWKKANPIVQKRLLRRLVDCLYYTIEGIKTYYFTDNLETEKRQSLQNKKAGDQKSSAFYFYLKNKFVQPSNQTVIGSSIGVNGADGRTRTCNLPVRSREFYPLNYDRTVRNN